MALVICFILGSIFGAVAVRYGLGLGTKLVYQIKEDKVLLERNEVEIPSHTGDREIIEQEKKDIDFNKGDINGESIPLSDDRQ